MAQPGAVGDAAAPPGAEAGAARNDASNNKVQLGISNIKSFTAALQCIKAGNKQVRLVIWPCGNCLYPAASRSRSGLPC